MISVPKLAEVVAPVVRSFRQGAAAVRQGTQEGGVGVRVRHRTYAVRPAQEQRATANARPSP